MSSCLRSTGRAGDAKVLGDLVQIEDTHVLQLNQVESRRAVLLIALAGIAYGVTRAPLRRRRKLSGRSSSCCRRTRPSGLRSRSVDGGFGLRSRASFLTWLGDFGRGPQFAIWLRTAVGWLRAFRRRLGLGLALSRQEPFALFLPPHFPVSDSLGFGLAPSRGRTFLLCEHRLFRTPRTWLRRLRQPEARHWRLGRQWLCCSPRRTWLQGFPRLRSFSHGAGLRWQPRGSLLVLDLRDDLPNFPHSPAIEGRERQRLMIR